MSAVTAPLPTDPYDTPLAAQRARYVRSGLFDLPALNRSELALGVLTPPEVVPLLRAAGGGAVLAWCLAGLSGPSRGLSTGEVVAFHLLSHTRPP
jgi:hypothetical protein